MSRAVFALFLWLLSAALSAQPALPADPAQARPPDRLHALLAAADRAVILEGAFDFNSNSLLNEMPASLWRGEYLNHELRDRSRNQLRVRNSAGYHIDARISYLGPRQQDWRSEISVAHHEHMGVRFPADLYNLTFYGNASYEARRADLGPVAFTRMRYQTIGFGARHLRQSHYVRVDLVLGQSLDAVDLRWADLYTGADGRVLRANVNGTYARSDTANSRTGTLNGLGLALSGRWQLPLTRSKGLVIELEAQDLGFCGWGRASQRLERDTTICFEGLTVDNILDLDQALLGEERIRDTLGVRFTSSSLTTWLPFRLSARLRGRINDRWKGAITVEQRNLPGYVPQLAFTGERSFGSRTNAGITLSMGGFGGLRIGLNATHVLGQHWLIALSTPHALAFITERTRGAGATFMIAYAL